MEKFLKHKTTELKPTDEIFLRLLTSKSSIFPPDEEKCREKKLLQESRQLGYEKDFAQAQCKFEAAEKLKLTIALKAKEFTDATKALNTAKRRLSATIDAYEYAKAQSWDEIIVHLEGPCDALKLWCRTCVLAAEAYSCSLRQQSHRRNA